MVTFPSIARTGTLPTMYMQYVEAQACRHNDVPYGNGVGLKSAYLYQAMFWKWAMSNIWPLGMHGIHVGHPTIRAAGQDCSPWWSVSLVTNRSGMAPGLTEASLLRSNRNWRSAPCSITNPTTPIMWQWLQRHLEFSATLSGLMKN